MLFGMHLNVLLLGIVSNIVAGKNPKERRLKETLLIELKK